MIKLNDVTTNTISTRFCDLKVGDYFIQNPTAIWMKIGDSDTILIPISGSNAIQITNNDSYFRYGIFKNDSIVEKIDIVSIDYRRVK